MNFRRVILTLIAASSYQSAAHAGWHSGGGELNANESNPWYLANTAVVPYCIQIDEANFGTSLSNAKLAIERAIAFWKNDLTYASRPVKSLAEVVTQEFRYVDCSADHSLTFQFGFLSADQQAKFASLDTHPQHFVGLSIRTDYDVVNLKAKGFVYISPESGPLRFDRDVLVHNPWSGDPSGTLLKFVLMHELGHVFGIPHIDFNLAWTDLMSPQFPESLLASEHNTRPTFFGPRTVTADGHPVLGYYDWGGSIPPAEVGEFFDVELTRDSNIQFEQTSENSIIVHYGPIVPVDWSSPTVGEIILDREQEKLTTPVIRIALTPSQRVFSNPMFAIPEFGPGILRKKMKGVYRSYRTGIVRPVLIDSAPLSFSISGLLGERLLLNILKGY